MLPKEITDYGHFFEAVARDVLPDERPFVRNPRQLDEFFFQVDLAIQRGRYIVTWPCPIADLENTDQIIAALNKAIQKHGWAGLWRLNQHTNLMPMKAAAALLEHQELHPNEPIVMDNLLEPIGAPMVLTPVEVVTYDTPDSLKEAIKAKDFLTEEDIAAIRARAAADKAAQSVVPAADDDEITDDEIEFVITVTPLPMSAAQARSLLINWKERLSVDNTVPLTTLIDEWVESEQRTVVLAPQAEVKPEPTPRPTRANRSKAAK